MRTGSAVGVCLIWICLIWSALLSAQPASSIERARDLYYAAAFEEALTMLEMLRPGTDADLTRIEGYRAACLIALGRPDEARDVMATLVLAKPDFSPDHLDVSPSIRALFASVRDELLPRMLPAAARFADLVLAAEAGSTPPDARRIYTAGDVGVIPPIVLEQTVPDPPASSRADFSGTMLLELQVSTAGTVESAQVQQSIHPSYDQAVLAAALTWRYGSATLNGEPVRFRKLLQIDVSPTS